MQLFRRLYGYEELELKGFELSGDASPIIPKIDSKSAIDLTQHKRSKHIRIKYNWIREQVGGKVVKLNHVPTVEMSADMMTKSPPEKLHMNLGLLTSFRYSWFP
jgi:hypothetical protein